MTIQWSLVLFTVLSGCGAGLFACTALDEFRGGAASKVRLPACAVAVALLVVGIERQRWQKYFSYEIFNTNYFSKNIMIIIYF